MVLGSGSCRDVGVPGRLVGALGLGSSPPHHPLLCGGSRLPLDSAGGLEDPQYCDPNPTKVWTFAIFFISDPSETHLILLRDLKAVSKLVRLGLHVKKAERQNLTVPKVFQR